MTDAQYEAKFQEMQKHIPFIQKLIEKLKGNNEQPGDNPRKAQLQKMEMLHELLTNRAKKLKMETLMKCEGVLIKLQAKLEKSDDTSSQLSAKAKSTTTSAPASTSLPHASDNCKVIDMDIASAPASPSPERTNEDDDDIQPVVIPTERRDSPIETLVSKAKDHKSRHHHDHHRHREQHHHHTPPHVQHHHAKDSPRLNDKAITQNVSALNKDKNDKHSASTSNVQQAHSAADHTNRNTTIVPTLPSPHCSSTKVLHEASTTRTSQSQSSAKKETNLPQMVQTVKVVITEPLPANLAKQHFPSHYQYRYQQPMQSESPIPRDQQRFTNNIEIMPQILSPAPAPAPSSAPAPASVPAPAIRSSSIEEAYNPDESWEMYNESQKNAKNKPSLAAPTKSIFSRLGDKVNEENDLALITNPTAPLAIPTSTATKPIPEVLKSPPLSATDINNLLLESMGGEQISTDISAIGTRRPKKPELTESKNSLDFVRRKFAQIAKIATPPLAETIPAPFLTQVITEDKPTKPTNVGNVKNVPIERLALKYNPHPRQERSQSISSNEGSECSQQSVNRVGTSPSDPRLKLRPGVNALPLPSIGISDPRLKKMSSDTLTKPSPSPSIPVGVFGVRNDPRLSKQQQQMTHHAGSILLTGMPSISVMPLNISQPSDNAAASSMPGKSMPVRIKSTQPYVSPEENWDSGNEEATPKNSFGGSSFKDANVISPASMGFENLFVCRKDPRISRQTQLPANHSIAAASQSAMQQPIRRMSTTSQSFRAQDEIRDYKGPSTSMGQQAGVKTLKTPQPYVSPEENWDSDPDEYKKPGFVVGAQDIQRPLNVDTFAVKAPICRASVSQARDKPEASKGEQCTSNVNVRKDETKIMPHNNMYAGKIVGLGNVPPYGSAYQNPATVYTATTCGKPTPNLLTNPPQVNNTSVPYLPVLNVAQDTIRFNYALNDKTERMKYFEAKQQKPIGPRTYKEHKESRMEDFKRRAYESQKREHREQNVARRKFQDEQQRKNKEEERTKNKVQEQHHSSKPEEKRKGQDIAKHKDATTKERDLLKDATKTVAADSTLDKMYRTQNFNAQFPKATLSFKIPKKKTEETKPTTTNPEAKVPRESEKKKSVSKSVEKPLIPPSKATSKKDKNENSKKLADGQKGIVDKSHKSSVESPKPGVKKVTEESTQKSLNVRDPRCRKKENQEPLVEENRPCDSPKLEVEIKNSKKETKTKKDEEKEAVQHKDNEEAKTNAKTDEAKKDFKAILEDGKAAAFPALSSFSPEFKPQRIMRRRCTMLTIGSAPLVDKDKLLRANALMLEDVEQREKLKRKKEEEERQTLRRNKNLSEMFQKTDDNCTVSTQNIISGKRSTRASINFNETQNALKIFKHKTVKEPISALKSSKRLRGATKASADITSSSENLHDNGDENENADEKNVYTDEKCVVDNKQSLDMEEDEVLVKDEDVKYKPKLKGPTKEITCVKIPQNLAKCRKVPKVIIKKIKTPIEVKCNETNAHNIKKPGTAHCTETTPQQADVVQGADVPTATDLSTSKTHEEEHQNCAVSSTSAETPSSSTQEMPTTSKAAKHLKTEADDNEPSSTEGKSSNATTPTPAEDEASRHVFLNEFVQEIIKPNADKQHILSLLSQILSDDKLQFIKTVIDSTNKNDEEKTEEAKIEPKANETESESEKQKAIADLGNVEQKTLKNEEESDEEEHPDEGDNSDDGRTSEKSKKNARSGKKKRNELDRLNEDIRDMFICEGVLTATGKRMCTLMQSKGKKQNDNETSKNRTTTHSQSISPQDIKTEVEAGVSAKRRVGRPRKVLTQPLRRSLRACKPNEGSNEALNDDEVEVTTFSEDSKVDITPTRKQMPILKPQTPIKLPEEELERSSIEDNSDVKKHKSVAKPCPRSKKAKTLTPKQEINDLETSSSSGGSDSDSDNQQDADDDNSLDTLKNTNVHWHNQSKYTSWCALCTKKMPSVSSSFHYKLHHGENYISRLAPVVLQKFKQGKLSQPLFGVDRSPGRPSWFYKCPFCLQYFNTPMPLWLEHFQNHTAEFRYECSKCHWGSNRLATTRRHLKTNCKGAKMVNSTVKLAKACEISAHICHLCNFVQLKRPNLERHYVEQHDVSAKNVDILGYTMALFNHADVELVAEDEALAKEEEIRKQVEMIIEVEDDKDEQQPTDDSAQQATDNGGKEVDQQVVENLEPPSGGASTTAASTSVEDSAKVEQTESETTAPKDNSVDSNKEQSEEQSDTTALDKTENIPPTELATEDKVTESTDLTSKEKNGKDCEKNTQGEKSLDLNVQKESEKNCAADKQADQTEDQLAKESSTATTDHKEQPVQSKNAASIDTPKKDAIMSNEMTQSDVELFDHEKAATTSSPQVTLPTDIEKSLQTKTKPDSLAAESIRENEPEPAKKSPHANNQLQESQDSEATKKNKELEEDTCAPVTWGQKEKLEKTMCHQESAHEKEQEMQCEATTAEETCLKKQKENETPKENTKTSDVQRKTTMSKDLSPEKLSTTALTKETHAKDVLGSLPIRDLLQQDKPSQQNTNSSETTSSMTHDQEVQDTLSSKKDDPPKDKTSPQKAISCVNSSSSNIQTLDTKLPDPESTNKDIPPQDKTINQKTTTVSPKASTSGKTKTHAKELPDTLANKDVLDKDKATLQKTTPSDVSQSPKTPCQQGTTQVSTPSKTKEKKVEEQNTTPEKSGIVHSGTSVESTQQSNQVPERVATVDNTTTPEEAPQSKGTPEQLDITQQLTPNEKDKIGTNESITSLSVSTQALSESKPKEKLLSPKFNVDLVTSTYAKRKSKTTGSRDDCVMVNEDSCCMYLQDELLTLAAQAAQAEEENDKQAKTAPPSSLEISSPEVQNTTLDLSTVLLPAAAECDLETNTKTFNALSGSTDTTQERFGGSKRKHDENIEKQNSYKKLCSVQSSALETSNAFLPTNVLEEANSPPIQILAQSIISIDPIMDGNQMVEDNSAKPQVISIAERLSQRFKMLQEKANSLNKNLKTQESLDTTNTNAHPSAPSWALAKDKIAETVDEKKPIPALMDQEEITVISDDEDWEDIEITESAPNPVPANSSMQKSKNKGLYQKFGLFKGNSGKPKKTMAPLVFMPKKKTKDKPSPSSTSPITTIKSCTTGEKRNTPTAEIPLVHLGFKPVINNIEDLLPDSPCNDPIDLVPELTPLEPLTDLNDISSILDSNLSINIEESHTCIQDALDFISEQQAHDKLSHTAPAVSETVHVVQTKFHKNKIQHVGYSLQTQSQSQGTNSVKYYCLIENCSFLFSSDAVGLENHFLCEHSQTRWNGFCCKCQTQCLCKDKEHSIVNEIKHMVDCHVNAPKLQTDTNSNDSSQHSTTNVNQTAEERPRIKLRRMTGDCLSTSNSESPTPSAGVLAQVVPTTVAVSGPASAPASTSASLSSTLLGALLNAKQKPPTKEMPPEPEMPLTEPLLMDNSNKSTAFTNFSNVFHITSVCSAANPALVLAQNNSPLQIADVASLTNTHPEESDNSSTLTQPSTTVVAGKSVGNIWCQQIMQERQDLLVSAAAAMEASTGLANLGRSHAQQREESPGPVIVSETVPVTQEKRGDFVITQTVSTKYDADASGAVGFNISIEVPTPLGNIPGNVSNLTALNVQEIRSQNNSPNNIHSSSLTHAFGAVSDEDSRHTNAGTPPITSRQYKCMAQGCKFTSRVPVAMSHHLRFHERRNFSNNRDYFDCAFCNYQAADVQDYMKHSDQYHIISKGNKPVGIATSDSDATTMPTMTSAARGNICDIISKKMETSAQRNLTALRDAQRTSLMKQKESEQEYVRKLKSTIEEIVQSTGFADDKLYRCVIKNCPTKLTEATFHNHIMYHISTLGIPNSNSYVYKCPHCTAQYHRPSGIKAHIKSHARNRYFCYMCDVTSVNPSQMMKHFSDKHWHTLNMYTKELVKATVTLSDDGSEKIYDSGYFVTYSSELSEAEVRKYGEKLILEWQRKKSGSKTHFKSSEIDLLPMQPIFQREVNCGECEYKTKVRTNMYRHLSMHRQYSQQPNTSQQSLVASVDPVNPVPCLNSNERFFDKMTNLASSSLIPSIAANASSPKVAYKLPHAFVPDENRYRCGVPKCNYISVTEDNFRMHISIIHNTAQIYRCPFCQEEICKRGVSFDRIINHLRFHSSILYRCEECNYVHHLRFVVERHINDKHAAMKVNLIRYERTDALGEGTMTVSSFAGKKYKEPTEATTAHPDATATTSMSGLNASKTSQTEAATKSSNASSSTSTTKSKGKWLCDLCNHPAASLGLIQMHCQNIHGQNKQYQCMHCSFGSQQLSQILFHIDDKHAGKSREVRSIYHKASNSNEIDVADTRPLWQRNDPKRVRHIRGILMEDEEESEKYRKKMGLDKVVDDDDDDDDCEEKQADKCHANTKSLANFLAGYEFGCFHCDYKTQKFEELSMSHHKAEHGKSEETTKPFIFRLLKRVCCPECRKFTGNFYEMQLHLLNTHNVRNYYAADLNAAENGTLQRLVCAYCSFNCVKPEQLAKHFQSPKVQHSPQDVSIENDAQIVQLLAMGTKQTYFRCTFCADLLPNRISIVHHATNLHDNEEGFSFRELSNTLIYQCALCVYSATSELDLLRHMIDHYGRFKRCHFCLETQVTFEGYMQHCYAEHRDDIRKFREIYAYSDIKKFLAQMFLLFPNGLIINKRNLMNTTIYGSEQPMLEFYEEIYRTSQQPPIPRLSIARLVARKSIETCQKQGNMESNQLNMDTNSEATTTTQTSKKISKRRCTVTLGQDNDATKNGSKKLRQSSLMSADNDSSSNQSSEFSVPLAQAMRINKRRRTMAMDAKPQTQNQEAAKVKRQKSNDDSTCNEDVFGVDAEYYTYYGIKPVPMDLTKVYTKVAIGGINTPLTIEKFRQLFNIDCQLKLNKCDDDSNKVSYEQYKHVKKACPASHKLRYVQLN